MSRLMYLDAASILILMILTFSMVYRKMYVRKIGKLYLLNIIVCMLAAISDILSVFPQIGGIDGAYFFSTLYFIFRSFMAVAYLLYIIEFVDPRRDKVKNNKFYAIIYIPYIINLIAIIFNPSLPHNACVFYYDIIDGQIIYNRGILIIINYFTSAIYLGFGLALVIAFRKFYGLPEFISIISIVPLTIISIILQLLFKELLIELFTSTLVLILIQSVIERQEKVLDYSSGLRNKNLFIDHIKRSYSFNRQCYIVTINIRNFTEMYNILSFDGANNYIKAIIHTIDTKYRDFNPNYYTFAIEKGMYAIVLDKLYDAKKIAKQIENDISYNEFVVSRYHPDLYLCVIDSPNDFQSYEDLYKFITRYNHNFKETKKILYVNEVKDDNTFKIKNNLDEIIDKAIKNDKFEVFYQPIIDIKKGKFNSAEALIRLKDEKYGFISPSLFVPYAETNGKINDIDNIVLERVFKFISSYDYKKLNLDYIEINLSMVDLMDSKLADRIIDLMKKYNVSCDSVNFEITESYETLDNEISKENIDKLKSLGFKFSLDDYGTGYSNIERFVKYPIKIVKIDKSLVDYSYDDSMKMVLKNTFNLISRLNRKTVVEGVETKDQYELFKNFGCDYIQGYYFSKPLPYNDFINFIEEKNKL